MNLLAQSANLPLTAWQNFYVIVGSSGGALIGLQFVVIALIANVRWRTTADSIHAFGTPNVVYFGAALAVSAIMCAPWPSLGATSVVLALCGVVGLAYAAVVFRRARRQTVYKPDLEDWFWYVIFPCVCYAALALAAFVLRAATQVALFVVAGAALGLLFIGINNAWD
ncbi:MAG TPA: hypothetical protein VGI81_14460, partial [Tepidisphaeraceae bacterium]